MADNKVLYTSLIKNDEDQNSKRLILGIITFNNFSTMFNLFYGEKKTPAYTFNGELLQFDQGYQKIKNPPEQKTSGLDQNKF